MKIFTMYLIFLLIVLNKIVDAEEDSSESKYIDLLPEKEKEDFLQRIARRILADVKTKDDREKYDGEISEDELNTHHEFVQKIFQEESDNLRRIDGREKNNDEIIEKNENPDDNLKVKSLETNKQSDLNREDDDKYLDLTLRHGKRNKRNEKSKEINVEVQVDKENTVEDNSTKHADIINEDQEKIKEIKVEEPSKIGSIEPKNDEQSDSEDIEIKLSRRSSSNDIKNDKNSSQVINTNPNDPNMTQSYNSYETPDNSKKNNIISQNESIFNDISTTPRSENESITVRKETTSREDELTTTDDYKSEENRNLSDNSLKNITTTENSSRKNLNNNVTDEVKSAIERAAVNITFVDENVVEKVNNKSAVADLEQVNTKDEIEETSTDNVDNLFENITTTENNSRKNMTDEVKSIVERAAVNVTPVDDNVAEEVNNKSIVLDIEQVNTKDEIEETSTDNVDNLFENITTTENNSRKNMTDEVKSIVERTAVNVTPVDDNVAEEVNNKSIVSDIEQDTKDAIEETTTENVDNFFENITTTENNYRNNMTDEIKSIVERATVIITSVDDNVVEKVNNNSTVANLKQGTKDAIEETTTDNVEIQNFTKHTESPMGATTHSNIFPTLNEPVETSHTITESTINNNGSIEIKYLRNKITMSNDDVNITGSIIDDSDKPVATTVKYNTDENDTDIYSRQGIHFNKDDTQKTNENISSTIIVDALEKKHNKNYLREYNVFEVPQGEPPFIQKDALANQEQPYYVPVHNYEPNNAYFNAHNRLGPNYDSDNKGRIIEKPLDADEKDYARFESDYFFDSKEKTHRKFRFRVSTKKPQNSKKLKNPDTFIASKPKYIDIYFNPDDYLDVDYYFSKMKRVSSKKKPSFPSSSDEGHPYHSIANEDLKDHIRAVRNIFWKQNHFGFISPPPPLGASKSKGKKKIKNEAAERPETSEVTDVTEVTEEPEEPEEIHQESNKDIYYRSKVDKDQPPTANKNIAIDYYFGRMPNENIVKVGYIKENNIIKDVLLKTDEIPSNNIINDIKVIKINEKQYVNNDIVSDTPHTFLTDSSQENEEDSVLQKPVKRISIYPPGKPKDPKPKVVHKGDINTIAKVARLTTMKDVFMHIQSMLSINLPVTRKNNGDIDAYVKALNDMVQTDDLALKRYDWLGTTVDIRAALLKLMDTTEAWQDRAILDPADIELLNYTLFLHKSANELIIKEDTEKINEALRKQSLLPRNKNKKKRLIKEKGLLQRVWLLRKKKYSEIYDFKALLNDFQYYLYDLHEAIKNIALVTKFSNQKWYENLKKIYFTPVKRKLLEVILHLCTTRLLGLIEDSAQNGLEDDFIDYIIHHKKEVKRTVEEFVFVLKLLQELKRI